MTSCILKYWKKKKKKSKAYNWRRTSVLKQQIKFAADGEIRNMKYIFFFIRNSECRADPVVQ